MPRPSDSDTLKDIIALTKYTMGFVPFTFIDFIDIILVAAIMFWIYRATRGTNAPYIISGIIMIYLMWVVVRTLNMELLSNILGQFVSVGVIALIIVFQPEIRRFLQMIGMRQKRFNFIARIFNRNDNIIFAAAGADVLRGAFDVVFVKTVFDFIYRGRKNRMFAMFRP
jgi:hypothetical protein